MYRVLVFSRRVVLPAPSRPMMITENSSFLNTVVNSDSKELLNTNLVRCS